MLFILEFTVCSCPVEKSVETSTYLCKYKANRRNGQGKSYFFDSTWAKKEWLHAKVRPLFVFLKI